MTKTVTDSYVRQLQLLHKQKSSFGDSGRYKHIDQWLANNRCSSIIDYGCGKGHVLENISKRYAHIRCTNYDPGYAKFSKRPGAPAELVICADVLEHIEPDLIDNVLKDIESLTLNTAYLIIDTKPAGKNLPDGRNAHLIVESQEWWTNKVETVTDFRIMNNMFWKERRVSMECRKKRDSDPLFKKDI